MLVQSRRRCCICFGLHRQIRVKQGQIAHLDRNRSNNAISNLAYLCLEHHDAYDSTTRQSKGFTAREVRAYRAELYRAVVPALERRARIRARATRSPRLEHGDEVDASLIAERQAAIQELLEKWGAIRGHAMLAHRLGLAAQGVERMLARLASIGLVRIDREPGTLKKTYSLAGSAENRLLDTFIASLGKKISSESRFVRKGMIDVDAVVKCGARQYVIDTVSLSKRASDELIARRFRALREARRQLGVPRAKCVLLVGITSRTAMASKRLRDFERRGLMVRYVDLGPA